VKLVTVHAWAIRGPTGLTLDGNFGNVFQDNDAVVPMRYFSKRSITYSDNTRSRVRLRMSGPGRLRLAQAVYTHVPENWGDGGATPTSRPAPASSATSAKPSSSGWKARPPTPS
jgi:hypothetical protein